MLIEIHDETLQKKKLEQRLKNFDKNTREFVISICHVYHGRMKQEKIPKQSPKL